MPCMLSLGLAMLLSIPTKKRLWESANIDCKIKCPVGFCIAVQGNGTAFYFGIELPSLGKHLRGLFSDVLMCVCCIILLPTEDRRIWAI